MSAAEDRWNKAQRLHVAGSVAPRLRDQDDSTKSRRVARVDKDGNVVGYTTLAEVQKALLRVREIELDVVDGTRPNEVVCAKCGMPVPVARTGRRVQFCRRCKQAKCTRCSAPMSPGASSPARNTRLAGKARHCAPCIKSLAAANRINCSLCEAPLSQKASGRWREKLRANPGVVVRCRPCFEKASPSEGDPHA